MHEIWYVNEGGMSENVPYFIRYVIDIRRGCLPGIAARCKCNIEIYILKIYIHL